jgi:formate hydrogenlyase subunit 3/multisubunit Na+/H+ antiporter MnhD subunit
MSGMIAIALILPVVLLPAVLRARWLGPALVAAPLPLLVLALFGEGAMQPALLLPGCGYAVEQVNRPLLLLAGAGWSIAGWFAADAVTQGRTRFGLCWLLTLAGQALALLAADLGSFYFGYTLMTVAAYGLVVHSGGDEARRAGRVYLVLAFAGEAMVLSGLLLLAGYFGNAEFSELASQSLAGLGVAPWLLFAGFCVKMGIAPLHFWLPLAHPVAPAPASAILSGLLVKAGLLGVLRFLPQDSLEPAGLLLWLGLATAAFGALMGLTQPRLKTVLAYSTISQMGLALTGFAAVQAAAPGAVAVVLLFALHHGMNKLALFLAAAHAGAGRWARVLFVLPALALAGLPLTSGAMAKAGLKEALGASGAGVTLFALSVSSLLTTLLLLHAFRLFREQTKGFIRPHPAWVCAVIAGAALPWFWLLARGLPPAWGWQGAVDALWPPLLGAAVYLSIQRIGWGKAPRVPEGDVVVWFERAAAGIAAHVGNLRPLTAWWRPVWPRARGHAAMAGVESVLRGVAGAGLCLLAVLLGLWWLLR